MNTTSNFSLNQDSLIEFHESLRALAQDIEHDVQIQTPNVCNYALNGYRVPGRLTVQGGLGDFCCMSFGGANGKVEGKVGSFFAHSIQSGALIVHGSAERSLGALGTGGLISVYGSAGDRVGIGLQGADIVVRGSIGSLGGLGMFNGTMIIGGNAGTELGKNLRGGTIYLRGEAESLSPHIEEVRMREPDKLKIGLLMLKAGIKVTGKEFRVFRRAT